MVKLLCAIVGSKGLFSINIARSATVGDLKVEIKKRYDIILKKIDAPDLKIFLATKDGAWLQADDPAALKLANGETDTVIKEATSGNPLLDTWPIDVVLAENGVTEQPMPNQVHVLVKVPFESNKRARLEAIEDVPRIDTKNATYVTLPGRLLKVCGFSSNDDMMLYCRPQVHELWRFLSDEVVGLKSRGIIVGPPGTGKSACTLSFLASLDHEEWNVVWIHLSNSLNYCVVLGTEQSWIITSLEKFELPRVANKKLFVCLDGYKQTEAHKSFLKTNIYADFHPENERVVVCSSMARLGKRNKQDDANAKIKFFCMYSWTLTEYHDAIANPVFYDKVAAKLDATCTSDVNDKDDGQDELSEDEKKNRALEYKYYYAGGSCQFMFQYTTGEVIKALNHAVNDAADKANLAMCSFGNFHMDFTSKLYDMQRDESLGGERLPVSSYVSDLFVIKSGLEVIADLAHRLMAECHASRDDFYFKWLLLVSISQCVVTLHGVKKEEDVHLPKAPILTFDPKKHFRKEEYIKLYSGVVTKCHENDTYDIEYENGKKVTRVPAELISLPVNEGACDIKLKVNDEVKARLKPNIKGNRRWLRPIDTKWNQGSYDAMYFDMEAGKVIFLKATRSGTLDFKMIFVEEVLLKLESAGMKISDVEVFFVTMKDQLRKFKIGNVHERYALQKYWTTPEDKHAKVRYLDIQILRSITPSTYLEN